MLVNHSIDFPGTYYIAPHSFNGKYAEFCEYGDIKIQVWTTNYTIDALPQEDLELLYVKVRDNVWMPLFFNGRLL